MSGIVNIEVINGLFSRVQIHRIGVYVNERVVRDFFRTCRKCEQFLLCKKHVVASIIHDRSSFFFVLLFRDEALTRELIYTTIYATDTSLFSPFHMLIRDLSLVSREQC